MEIEETHNSSVSESESESSEAELGELNGLIPSPSAS